jgi:uncharacterized protein (TIGR02284 family)
MSDKKLVDHLTSLVQLDIDAVEAYEQALKNIDVIAIYEKLQEFRNDHMQHIEVLSKVIRGLGGKTPQITKDIKGFIIKGFTAIRSATGTKGALKAMQTNEQLTNSTYKNALDWNLPPDVRAVVESNYKDEQRHLAYIKEQLESIVFN